MESETIQQDVMYSGGINVVMYKYVLLYAFLLMLHFGLMHP